MTCRYPTLLLCKVLSTTMKKPDTHILLFCSATYKSHKLEYTSVNKTPTSLLLIMMFFKLMLHLVLFESFLHSSKSKRESRIHRCGREDNRFVAVALVVAVAAADPNPPLAVHNNNNCCNGANPMRNNHCCGNSRNHCPQ